MLDRIANEPGMLEALRMAHPSARERFWELHGAPERLMIDVDATSITAHSEKDRRRGPTSMATGFTRSPLIPTRRAKRSRSGCGAGNAGSNTAADHVTVIDRCLAQIPDAHIDTIEILVRADGAGATHGTADHCRRCDLRFSFGYELTEAVRTAILQTPADAWIPALDQNRAERENGQVVELIHRTDLSCWPVGPG